MITIDGTVTGLSYHSGTLAGDDGRTYKFNRKAVESGEGDFDQIRQGQRVRFRPDGERARDVNVLEEIVEMVAKPARHPQTTRTAPYRFLNPYNFARSLEVRNQAAEPLLGRCAPPPHDRFIGHSGRITCKLTTVTPLFVSDSEGVTEETVGDKVHRHYRFFKDPDGNVVIPGTSLRGSVRSIFETATNSCYANFAGNRRLSFHLPPGDALRLVPARVRKVSNDRWELDLLPGTTPVNPDRRPSGPQYAAWVHTYRPLWASQTATRTPQSTYAARKKISLAGFEHGMPCQAIIEPVQHPLRSFEFWNVVHLAAKGQTLPKTQGNQRAVSGYVCITNQNIENKHDERVFFSAQQLPPVELPPDARKKYEELIADYQERHGDAVRKRQQPARPKDKDPAFSRFILERTGRRDHKLADKDLVYAMLTSGPGGFAVQFIVPVSVPRVGFKQSIGDLLHPGELEKCHEYDHLCPACRTFGWVWGGEDPDATTPSLEMRTAYAGRVRFSYAKLKEDAGVFDSTLAILSTPKPTTSRFYLRPKNDRPRDGLPDHEVDYDASGQVLRGRKVYRHHGDRLNAQEYQSVNGARSDQNRTAHGVQKSGSVFEFTVNFENLAEVELGALLWALSLEGWHHRIGFGKPLGFGSAQIEVVEVMVLHAENRYATVEQGPTALVDLTEMTADWISAFKQAVEKRFGAPFEQLGSICDLRELLADSPSLPIHYPRPTQKPQAEGKQFEWFVGNKRSGQDAGPRLVLPLADEDTKGLPLVDKQGDRQS